MSPEVVRVSPEAIGQMEGGKSILYPTMAYVGIEDGKVCGAGGLAWYLDRCWLWLGMVDLTARTHPICVVRNAKKMLRIARQMGEDAVYSWRDEHPLSAKLLKMVGFEFSGIELVTFADGSASEKEVWVTWPLSQ